MSGKAFDSHFEKTSQTKREIAFMTQQRSQYLYKFSGTIQSKTRRVNPKYSQYFYQLNITCTNFPQITKIFAFKAKLLDPQIWPILESDHYLGKTYLFSCRNYRGSYYLVNWEELTSSRGNKPQIFNPQNLWPISNY